MGDGLKEFTDGVIEPRGFVAWMAPSSPAQPFAPHHRGWRSRRKARPCSHISFGEPRSCTRLFGTNPEQAAQIDSQRSSRDRIQGVEGIHVSAAFALRGYSSQG
jgi:hypothetical protein